MFSSLFQSFDYPTLEEVPNPTYISIAPLSSMVLKVIISAV